jgi:L-threonylcarbamoyladenylate synthase
LQTRYLTANELHIAGELLAHGRIVAFPTETVYGLGANALDPKAISNVFQAKGRPSDNPLIVHIFEMAQLKELVRPSLPINEPTQALMRAFWPGALTLVFPKHPSVPDIVTAGLDTVAVRMSSHGWAREILKSSGVPVAAPSANRSGSPSATTWESVREDLDGQVDAIVCGPACDAGLESTVVDATTVTPRILRPGLVTWEQILVHCPSATAYQPQSSRGTSQENSPGLRHRHYQPKAEVVLEANSLVSAVQQADSQPQTIKLWYIGLVPPSAPTRFDRIQICSSIEHYARELYSYFRQADQAGVAKIICEPVSEAGFGQAIMDRLRRASEPK